MTVFQGPRMPGVQVGSHAFAFESEISAAKHHRSAPDAGQQLLCGAFYDRTVVLKRAL
jgi:hypothetical protein